MMQTTPPATPRKPWRQRLVDDMLEFHTETDMKLTTIGSQACGNARLWKNLEDGQKVSMDIADRVYDFMAAKGYYFPNS